MKLALLAALCLLSGCFNVPKQLHYGPYRSAYRWTFSRHLMPAQDTEARRLWQNYIEAQVAWEWAWYQPPDVTGFTHGEEWIAQRRKYAADRRLFEFIDTIR